MKTGLAFCCIAGAALAAFSTAASACGAGAILFEDNFTKLAPAWGFVEKDDTRTNGANGVSYKLTPGNSVFLMNSSGTYEDHEICGKYKVDKIGDESAGFSLLFWMADNKNYYGVSVSPRYGTFQVWREQRGKFLVQSDWKENAAVNKGDNAENEIDVAIKGKHVTVNVNGKNIFEMDGQPPPDGSLVGFDMFATNTNKSDKTVTLSKYEVHELK